MYCYNCGHEINSASPICVNCGCQLYGSAPNPRKSKLAAGLFGIFLGGLGVHNFYLGYKGKAISQLLITVLTFGFGSVISSLWGLIEGILILTGDISTDASGTLLRG